MLKANTYTAVILYPESVLFTVKLYTEEILSAGNANEVTEIPPIAVIFAVGAALLKGKL